MAAKIVSQRKWAKLVASTGALAQPPGALSRMSNLLFTQRGSLQIADGSYPIGRLPGANTVALAIGTFATLGSGSYPYYPTIVAPPGAAMPDQAPWSVQLNAQAGLANPAGYYTFAFVASDSSGSVHSNYTTSLATVSATAGFGSVTFSDPIPAVAGIYYSVYYLPGGPSASTGVLLFGPTLQLGAATTAANTALPVTPLVSLPAPNNSYNYSLAIGNLQPPSKTVIFTAASAVAIPALQPQPMLLAPGSPSFTYQSTFNQSSAYTTTGASASASQTGKGVNAQTSASTAAFTSEGVSSGTAVAATLQVTTSAVFSIGAVGSISFAFNYSVDGGTTWQAGQAVSAQGSQAIQLSISGLTNLNTLRFQVVVTVTVATGTISATGAINSVQVSIPTQTTITPYGGVSGYAGPLPQILQFAQLAILILGNGYAPRSVNPALLSSATLTALANTFTASYPTWQASVDWVTGAQLTAGGYYFTATQGGVSGTTAPTWNNTKGAETADGSVIWTSQGAIVASVAPRGAAHAVAYAGSLWLANTSPQTTSDGIDGPTCLKMSDSNNPNSWNPVNTAFIGRDDGTQITGLQPFTIAALGISPTGSLCVFKEFTTYQVIGVFGSTSFEIQPAQTNLGCIASRSIQFLPGFGVCRFTHLGFAVFDGINDRLISEDIRPYLFGGVDSEADLTPVDPGYVYLAQSAQTTAPPMYLCAMPLLGNSGQLTRLFCYDLVMKAWAVLDLPWPISSLGSMSVGEGYPLVLAGKTDGTIQRMQSGDLAWDTGATDQSNVAWSFRTPDVFGEGSSQRLFYEQATVRGYGSATMVKSILARLWLDGQQLGAQAVDVVPQGGSNIFEARVKIFRTGYRAHLDLSGNGGGAAGVIDSIDWAVSPKSSLARRIIS